MQQRPYCRRLRSSSRLPHAGTDIRHACYAHTWDASRTRLYVGGGPLAFGLSGCYMAVWN